MPIAATVLTIALSAAPAAAPPEGKAPTPAAGKTAPGPASSAPAWPLTLRLGIPASLPGWSAAPSDPLPDEGENGMGRYTEVSRFFQKIESATSTKQFQIAVQDYGAGRDLGPELKKAVGEAAQHGAETKEATVSGLKAFVVTDRSAGKPATIVTVVVSGGRLVLGEGANMTGDEALRLLASVDFAKIAAAK
jgi:hypothetical protein